MAPLATSSPSSSSQHWRPTSEQLHHSGATSSYIFAPISTRGHQGLTRRDSKESLSSIYSDAEDEPISPLPRATLKRSSHIRRPNGATARRKKSLSVDSPLTPSSRRLPPPTLRPIDTDMHHFTTPPRLDVPRSLPSVSPRSPLRKAILPPPGASPKSTLSSSFTPTARVTIEWDPTGFIKPAKDLPTWSEDPEEPAHLKRASTAVIVELLRLRRVKAGLES